MGGSTAIISSKKIDDLIMNMKCKMPETTIESLDKDVSLTVANIDKEFGIASNDYQQCQQGNLLTLTNMKRGKTINGPLLGDAKITNEKIINTTNSYQNGKVNFNMSSVNNVLNSTHDPIISLTSDDLMHNEINNSPENIKSDKIIKNEPFIFKDNNNECNTNDLMFVIDCSRILFIRHEQIYADKFSRYVGTTPLLYSNAINSCMLFFKYIVKSRSS